MREPLSGEASTMQPRSESSQRTLEAQIQHLFEHKIVFNEFLGLKLNPDEPGCPCVVFSMRPEFVGHFQFDRLHGGVISSVLDVVGGLAVMYSIAAKYDCETPEQIMQRFTPLATIDMRIDYLRQGIGGKFVARADVKRLGQRIATTQAMLVNEDGVEIASANAAYMVS